MPIKLLSVIAHT